MNGLIDRASSMLYPENGRRALDVKFFFTAGASAESLAEQVIVCMAALDDESTTITNVDLGLTAQGC